MNARHCTHGCGAATFTDACEACRTRTHLDRSDDEPRPVRSVSSADLAAAEERQQRRLAAQAYAQKALELLRQAADLAPEECQAQLDAAGRAAEKASLDLGWYAERSATGIDLLRRQVAA